MNKKRVLFFGVLMLLTVVAGVTWGQLSQKKSTTQTPIITEQPAFPPPAYTTQPAYRIDVSVSFPKDVPTYTITGSPSARTVASSLVPSLGITGAPKEIKSTTGNVYVWNGNNRSLVASERLSHIAYSGPAGTSGPLNKPLESYYLAAEQFISLFNLTKPPIQLIRLAPRYFNPSRGDANETASATSATNIQLNFQYAIGAIPIYVGTGTVPSASVRLNASGEILTATAFLLPNVSAAGESVALLTSQEAGAKLARGEGRITDLASGDMGDAPYYFDSPPTIVDVADVELAYYYSPQQKTLIPVYALRGTGEIQNKTVKTTTLVSAVK